MLCEMGEKHDLESLYQQQFYKVFHCPCRNIINRITRGDHDKDGESSICILVFVTPPEGDKRFFVFFLEFLNRHVSVSSCIFLIWLELIVKMV